MKHMLMDPKFPDLVGEWAAAEMRGAEEPSLLESLEEAESAEDIAEAILDFAAAEEIDESRCW